jgi:NAD(P)-dependent dehydrogenase (short-subunit alcohol dehydrogenase family)
VSEKIWFITGTSRGFGREWTVAALDRGDKVAATARNAGSLKDLAGQHGDALLTLELDETNLVGALWVTQAALPFLRAQGGGHILQVSSIGGISAFTNVGMYHASKWGLEGFSQALAQEVAGFGIKVTIIEPGGFSTDWGGSSAKHATALDAYDMVREESARFRAQRSASPGDPAASSTAVLAIVDAAEPPLRCFFGSAPLGIATADYESRLDIWRKWQPIAELAQGQAD